jgi:hypothetical protein
MSWARFVFVTIILAAFIQWRYEAGREIGRREGKMDAYSHIDDGCSHINDIEHNQ